MNQPVRRRVGVIVPPRYFDTNTRELLALQPEIDVLHTQLRLGDDFAYELEQIAASADEVEACARSLAEAGSEVVIQIGTPFSTVHGWDGAVVLRARIEENIGVPFEMMGLSVVEAVRALGFDRVALATGYYDTDWVERYRAFVTGAGLEISSASSFTDQGHFATGADAFAAAFNGFDAEFIARSIEQVATDDPDAPAVLVPGVPGAIVAVLGDLENRIGRPVVTHLAMWWACLQRLGLGGREGTGLLLSDAGARTHPRRA